MRMLVLLAAIAGSPSTLVLDARERPACRKQASEDLVVCGPDEVLTPIVDAVIDGTPAKVLIEPGGTHDLICNPNFIARARLIARGMATLATVGTVDVRGGYGNVGLKLAGRTGNYPIRWGPLPTVRDADCVIGPRHLPFDRIRFVLGDPRPAAVTTRLPFHSSARGHLYVAHVVGGEKLAVRFEREYARSLLTAPAAQVIAPDHGGTSTGPVLGDRIAYGVRRPVRAFHLHRPLRIGSLTLAAPYVRVQDYGNAMNIRSLDPDVLVEGDLVVAAKRPKPGALKLVRVGGDDLSRCVELVMDKQRREATLTC